MDGRGEPGRPDDPPPGGGFLSTKRYAILAVDAGPFPRQVDIIEADEKGVPKTPATKDAASTATPAPNRFAGIYRFDTAGRLVVVLPTKPGAPRPTSFGATAAATPQGVPAVNTSTVTVYLSRERK